MKPLLQSFLSRLFWARKDMSLQEVDRIGLIVETHCQKH
jgi:hypothetical protein